MQPRHALYCLFATTVLGCSGSPGPSSHEASGTAQFSITQVPPTVQCVEIDVTGGILATQRFPVKGGESSILQMGGLPVGNVDVTGAAFDTPCSDAGAPATWVTQSVVATIPEGSPGNVTLEFFPAGSANVGVDFNGTTFRTVTTFAGTAGVRGNADGIGAAASFTRPQQLAFGNGNLYVADARSNVIRSISVSTAAVTTIAGTPGPGGSADGVGGAASFLSPIGVAFDGASNSVFVADFSNDTIRRIDLATNGVSTFAGTVGTAGSTDGVGGAALFNHPYAIAADGGGNLFVTDSGNATIRQIVVATATVSTLTGSPGQTGSVDGLPAVARFSSPGGVTTDGTSLYLTDGSAIRQVIIATGRVFTIAGDPSTQGAADGFGGHFNTPEGIALDPAAQILYVTDFLNSNVREVNLNTGLVTTAAGSAQVFGSADGTGLAAQFHFPIGVALDASGNVYVADAANATIRKM